MKGSYAGVNAKTADVATLEEAKKQVRSGKTAEEVRKNTGWYKGRDGNWRFEIDDSIMQIDTNGNFMSNPDIRRYNELLKKAYIDMTATDEEIKDLQGLDRSMKGVRMTPEYLGEMVKHDALFDAYPELRDVRVVFLGNTGNTEGAYHTGLNEIVLRKGLKLEPERLKDVLVHEMQHAIQEIEGTSRGANPEYWEDKKRRGYNTDRTGRELYMNTAGEIEARDTAKRRKLTTEQRKETEPDLGDENTVFADGAELFAARGSRNRGRKYKER